MQVSPAEGNVSLERYASAGHALTGHHSIVGVMHRSALAQHHTAAVATLRHSCTRCELAYYVHCHARLYIQDSCLSWFLFVNSVTPMALPCNNQHVLQGRAGSASHLRGKKAGSFSEIPLPAGLAQRQV